MDSFYGIGRLVRFLCSSALSTTINMATCCRLTWVRSVTIRIEHKEDLSGKVGATIVGQSILVEAVTNHLSHLESLIIDLYGPYVYASPWTQKKATSNYLTAKIGGLRLRNICARTHQYRTFHFWSCLDDSAVDFVKTATNGAIVEDVFIASLPGSHLSPAVFDSFSPTPNLTFYTTIPLAGLEGLQLEKCGELGLLSKEEAEEKEIKAADAILTKMSSGRCNLYEVTMAKVFR